MSFSLQDYKDSGFVIGEIAQSHDGSLGQCYAYVDAVSVAGGHAVKFQTHIAEAESTPGEPWRVKFSNQDETRFEYWQRMEFSASQWKGLKEYTESKGLVFMSSAFSFEAVDLLEDIGMEVWKLASGEINNFPLLERIAATRKPVIISSGMSYIKEIEEAVHIFKSKGIEVAVVQCTSAYPCPPEQVGLNLIPEFKEKFGCMVGLSDHSGTIFPGLAAAALGGDILEVHITFDRGMFGPDVPASVTMPEFKQLVDGYAQIKTMLNNPIDKDKKADELIGLRDLFTKSLVVATDLHAGKVIEENDVLMKKPGTGIPASDIAQIIGKTLTQSKNKNELFSWEDFKK